jgi:tetratricopeptide (TPR) repeat protein
MSTRGIVRLLVFLVLNFGPGLFLSRGQDPPPAIPAATITSDKPAKMLLPERPPSPLKEAQQFCWNGEYKRAAALYNEIIAGGTDVAAAYAGLARVYLKIQKIDDAQKAAAKAVELEPTLATAHAALGEVYFRHGELQDAEQEFLSALQANNKEARAYLGLAHLYLATFNKQRAKAALDRAHALDPKDPEINGDWLETRPASEQIRALEAFVAAGGHGEHVPRAGARQTLALLKDQALHPGRTCQMVNKLSATQMNLEPLFRENVRQRDRLYPGVGLDVRLNRYASRLMLETGDRIIINQKTAEKAGVQQVFRTEAEGVGDENPPEGYIGYVEYIKISEIEFKGCYVTVLEDVSPNNSLSGFDGIVGAGLFSNYLVEIDVHRYKLKLAELPPGDMPSNAEKLPASDAQSGPIRDRFIPPQMADWAPLYRSGNLLLVPTHANESAPKLFCLALGAVVNLISPDAAREAGKVIDDRFMHLRGLNGSVKTSLRTAPIKLQFAGAEYKSDGISVVDISPFSRRGIEVSGTIGFEVLRDLDMKIDYRDGLISLGNGKERE